MSGAPTPVLLLVLFVTLSSRIFFQFSLVWLVCLFSLIFKFISEEFELDAGGGCSLTRLGRRPRCQFVTWGGGASSRGESFI